MPSWEGILSEDQQRKDVLAFVTMELVVDRSWQDEEFEELHVLELEKLAAQAVPILSRVHQAGFRTRGGE